MEMYHHGVRLELKKLFRDACHKCYFWDKDIPDCYEKRTGYKCNGGYWKEIKKETANGV